MQYNEFLTNLFADGRVTVPALAPLLEGELAAGDDVIAEHVAGPLGHVRCHRVHDGLHLRGRAVRQGGLDDV